MGEDTDTAEQFADRSGADEPADATRSAVQSVDRALQVLEIVADRGEVGVSDIARELGVHKSTASRLIAALQARGYTEKTPGQGRFRLGYAVARLARATSSRVDLARVGQDVCDDLAARVRETTNLAILDGDRVVNVVETYGPGEVALRTWVGQICPAHATSSGKALLAALAPAVLRDRLPPTLPTFTARTVADRAALEAELAEVRRRGWASVTEELEVGLNAVSAPVVDAAGLAVAALSVSGPAYRLDPARFTDVAALTAAAAAAISRRLGRFD